MGRAPRALVRFSSHPLLQALPAAGAPAREGDVRSSDAGPVKLEALKTAVREELPLALRSVELAAFPDEGVDRSPAQRPPGTRVEGPAFGVHLAGAHQRAAWHLTGSPGAQSTSRIFASLERRFPWTMARWWRGRFPLPRRHSSQAASCDSTSLLRDSTVTSDGDQDAARRPAEARRLRPAETQVRLGGIAPRESSGSPHEFTLVNPRYLNTCTWRSEKLFDALPARFT